MTRPEAEEALEKLYGDGDVDKKWEPLLKTITELEPDSDMAPILAKIDAYLQNVENELMGHVKELRKRNRIHGEPLTVDEIVDLVEEAETGEEGQYGENAEEKIVDQVQYERAVKNGEIIEVDDEDDDGDTPPDISLRELLATCQTLQTQCLTQSLEDPKLAEQGMELMEQIWRFKGVVQKHSTKNAKQVQLDSFFTRK
ncbi:hypothetical protein F5890DRAFT_1560290 [Lentinula detonsa]|uniref:Uncharacterized protein n=1 Tax=Lentinula detonsa TaxID=2804962 RepID=A0AA38UNY0_9AGAR|nr:hypothetical protein F5890DRAFT_1560290 [Lentinula detonsa]